MHTDSQIARLARYETIARNAFWWYPFKDIVFVCDRPNEINRDNQTRLHSEFGPTISFQDGWELFYWHGIEIPKRLILQPETYSAEEMLAESNTEIRRCMFEKIGYQKVFDEMKPKIIERWNGYDLYHIVTRPGEEDIRLIKCVCPSTGREYYNRVPPDVPDCLSALTWRFSCTPEEYQTAEHS